MRSKIGCVLVVIVCGFVVCAWAGGDGVWIGKQFRPEQCLKIAAGRYEVKRKLCTIAYDIHQKNGLFEVNGRLRFDKTFIPDKVSHVELEVLLLNQAWVCTRQVDLRAEVKENQASFTFKAEDLPGQSHVRTYYIIYYRQQ